MKKPSKLITSIMVILVIVFVCAFGFSVFADSVVGGLIMLGAFSTAFMVILTEWDK